MYTMHAVDDDTVVKCQLNTVELEKLEHGVSFNSVIFMALVFPLFMTCNGSEV